MDDFFKNLKSDPVFQFDDSNMEYKIDQSNLILHNRVEDCRLGYQTDENKLTHKDENCVNVQQKDENSVIVQQKDGSSVIVQQKDGNTVIVQQKDEQILNTVKAIDRSDTDEKLKNKEAIEEWKDQPKPNPNEDNTVIINSKADAINKLIGNLDPTTPRAVDVREINEKLNEITEQSQAAIEDLRSQSTKIIDTARAQTNKVLENAKYNFSVFTKAMEEELEPKTELPVDDDDDDDTDTFDELIEKYSRTGHMMDFLN